MKKCVSIAIDGPAAAGKSSVAKILASKYKLVYIDTGAMYRAFTYAVIKAGLNPKDEVESCTLIGKVKIELKPNHIVLCNGEDVTKEIRTFEVSSNVSYIASYKDIRLELVDQQRALAEKESVIMDGRDIGTYVLPNADLKIFQVADLRKRAERRYIENIEKGISCNLEDVIKDLENRDFIDSNRAFAPLSAASDAIVLDTSDMTIFEVVTSIGKLMEEKLGLKENE
jgi:cytidylate kinase